MKYLPEGKLIECDDGVKRRVIKYSTALKEGKKRFFTGKPCKYGHVEERRTSGYICVACAREKQKKRHRRRMLTDKEYRRKFLDKRNKRHHTRYANDPEYKQKFIDRAKAYRSKKQ